MLGISGVAVLVGWSSLPFTREVMMSVLFSILSTLSYAFAGVYAKKAFQDQSPLAVAVGQQMGASVLMLPLAVLDLPIAASSLSAIVIFSVLGLALFCTAIGYLLYFYLIASVGPTKTLSVTFLIPLFGVIWGALFLHEQITFGTLAGLAVILSSIFLISELPLPAFLSNQQKETREQQT
jgi:drug/metabolite transporter (DMT)-like permease